MPDPWRLWEERFERCGRIERVAEELNDAEILILLADDEPGRETEKQILAEEAERRMAKGREGSTLVAYPPETRRPWDHS